MWVCGCCERMSPYNPGLAYDAGSYLRCDLYLDRDSAEVGDYFVGM